MKHGDLVLKVDGQGSKTRVKIGGALLNALNFPPNCNDTWAMAATNCM